MSYIGNNLQTAFPSYLNIDDISGSFDGVTTSFPLTVGGVAPVPAPLSSNQCLISVGGVVQRPDDSGTEGFLLSGGNIVFSAAPAALDDFFGVILAGADYVNVGVNFPSGTATTPSITFDTDLDTGIYNPGANEIGFTTAGVNRVTINSSGNVSIVNDLTVDTNTLHVDSTNNRVGIGTTSPSRQLQVENASGNAVAAIVSGTGSSSFLLLGDTADDNIGQIAYSNVDNALFFDTNGSERARIDSSGRLLVGTSSTSDNSLIQIQGRSGLSTGPAEFALRKGALPASGDSIAVIKAQDNSGNLGASIVASADANWASGTSHPTRLVFSTTADGASSPTERMLISSFGVPRFFSSDTGIIAGVTAVAGTSEAIFRGRHTATNILNGTDCIFIRSNGNVENTNNSYGAISDIKLKENIVDATSQWNDIKALQVRKYNFKEGETHTQIGLIAQEVELVSPGLVSESPDRDAEGNDLGTVTKSVNYSVLYMKAVKALQEAMERIETLEASNTDLLARVSALESA